MLVLYVLRLGAEVGKREREFILAGLTDINAIFKQSTSLRLEVREQLHILMCIIAECSLSLKEEHG